MSRPAVRAVDRVRLRDEALRLDPGAAEGEVRRAEGAEGLGRALEPRFVATVDQAEPALPGCHAVEVDEDEEVGTEDLAVAPHGVARHRRAADARAALVLAVAVTAPVHRGRSGWLVGLWLGHCMEGGVGVRTAVPRRQGPRQSMARC